MTAAAAGASNLGRRPPRSRASDRGPGLAGMRNSAAVQQRTAWTGRRAPPAARPAPGAGPAPPRWCAGPDRQQGASPRAKAKAEARNRLRHSHVEPANWRPAGRRGRTAAPGRRRSPAPTGAGCARRDGAGRGPRCTGRGRDGYRPAGFTPLSAVTSLPIPRPTPLTALPAFSPALQALRTPGRYLRRRAPPLPACLDARRPGRSRRHPSSSATRAVVVFGTSAPTSGPSPWRRRCSAASGAARVTTAVCVGRTWRRVRGGQRERGAVDGVVEPDSAEDFIGSGCALSASHMVVTTRASHIVAGGVLGRPRPGPRRHRRRTREGGCRPSACRRSRHPAWWTRGSRRRSRRP